MNSIRHIFGALCLLTCVQAAHGVGVQPMVFELDAIGANSRTVMTIDNDGQRPLSVELIPHRVSLDVDGKQTLTPADDDLLIFPPVALVAPGTAQTVQVQYVGNPEIDTSVPYRVSVMQVPVAVAEEETNPDAVEMKIAANFHTLLNVVPSGTEAKLSVLSIKDNGSKWMLEVENSGNRFARLSTTRWSLTSGAQSVELKPMEVAQRTDNNLVLPKSVINVSFQPPEGFDVDSTELDIQTN